MPLDPAFVEECFYLPEGLLIDEILDVDVADSRIRVRMPTHDDLPITRTQRVHPVLHPRHVSGGLMIHMTGVAGMVHAYYVLGLRHSEGWVGYGGEVGLREFDTTATRLPRNTGWPENTRSVSSSSATVGTSIRPQC